MTETRLGPWVRRFLLEYLVGERNLARNTQQSYRDSLTLLIPFIAGKVHKTVDQLEIDHFTAEHVRQFLQHLEEARGCSIPTRNQRLAAIHALAHFIAERGPEHIEWCGQIQAVPFKRAAKASITYLEKSEMDALLAAPARNSPQGRRDYALLLFLYNTGARADEAAQLSIGDLRLAEAPRRDHSSVQIRGKGNKLRFCPLWTHTVRELEALVGEKAPTEHVFINRCGRPLTRFGIHTMVKRYARKVAAKMPGLAAKRVGPHSIRHTCASHLLRAGVDIKHDPRLARSCLAGYNECLRGSGSGDEGCRTCALRGEGQLQTRQALASGRGPHGLPEIAVVMCSWNRGRGPPAEHLTSGGHITAKNT